MRISCALQNKNWTFKTQDTLFLVWSEIHKYLLLLVRDRDVGFPLDNTLINKETKAKSTATLLLLLKEKQTINCLEFHLVQTNIT